MPYAAAIQADYIAVSFPRNGADIEYARGLSDCRKVRQNR